MKTSLIITTYNKPEALGKVLEGIGEQSHMPDEILVADDGSGPDTLKKIHEFSKVFRCRFDHIWQEDQGFRAARIRNRAIAKATGEYIILLDGDCIPPRRFIEDHLVLAEESFFSREKDSRGQRTFTRFFVYRRKLDLETSEGPYIPRYF